MLPLCVFIQCFSLQMTHVKSKHVALINTKEFCGRFYFIYLVIIITPEISRMCTEILSENPHETNNL
jgi:hypothetical protein